MSSRKSQLLPYQNIINGDMSANVTSAVTNITYEDNIAIFLSFTGTPTGSFDVQGSLDNANWGSLQLSSTPVASGGPDSIIIDMSQVPFNYLRIVYTRTGGVGTLNGTIAGKQI